MHPSLHVHYESAVDIYIYIYIYKDFGSNWGCSSSIQVSLICKHRSLGVVVDYHTPTTVTEIVLPEEAWHRNDRSKRQRARKVVRSAAAGEPRSGKKLVAAEAVLLQHHATRGAAREAMGHGKNGKGSGAASKVPWPNDWQCVICSVVGAPVFVHGRWDTCGGCNNGKPLRPHLYSETVQYKSDNKGGNGKGGKAAGGKGDKGKGGKGGKGGQGGKETATAKKVREMQEEKEEAFNLQQLKILEAEKKGRELGIRRSW